MNIYQYPSIKHHEPPAVSPRNTTLPAPAPGDLPLPLVRDLVHVQNLPAAHVPVEPPEAAMGPRS